MADDLYDAFGGTDDLFMDEEEGEEEPGATEEAEGEGQNRTFILAVAIMGGLLVCAIGAFMVWALVINPRMQAGQQASGGITPADETATSEALLEETPTLEGEPIGEPEETQVTVEEPTDIPTNTPRPPATSTPTPVVGATNTPSSEPGEGEGETEGQSAETGEGGEEDEGGEEQAGTPTVRARRTDTPTPTPLSGATATPRATSTAGGTSGDTPPDTGLGEVLLIVGAIGLLGILFASRKLRQA